MTINQHLRAICWPWALSLVLSLGCASIKKELIEQRKETYENGTIKSITYRYKITRGRETSESPHDYLTVTEYYTEGGQLVRKEECRSESMRVEGLKGPTDF